MIQQAYAYELRRIILAVQAEVAEIPTVIFLCQHEISQFTFSSLFQIPWNFQVSGHPVN